jgi:hypothetical protein
MQRILLDSGNYALVDDKDYEVLNKFMWCELSNSHHIYAVRNISHNLGGGSMLMHRQILCLPSGTPLVDHRDRNGLNNQRSNLRICNSSQNQANSKIRSDNTSGYKGVHRKRGKWKAALTFHDKEISLGSYSDIKDAALAYNEAAIKYFGKFARVNIMEDARYGGKA